MKVYRHGNRKLYCPELGRYVQQHELLAAVRRGEPVKVLCHKTRVDITADILLGAYARLYVGQVSLERVERFVRGQV